MNTTNETNRVVRHLGDVKTIIAEAVVTIVVIMMVLAGLLYAAILYEGQKTRDLINDYMASTSQSVCGIYTLEATHENAEAATVEGNEVYILMRQSNNQ